MNVCLCLIIHRLFERWALNTPSTVSQSERRKNNWARMRNEEDGTHAARIQNEKNVNWEEEKGKRWRPNKIHWNRRRMGEFIYIKIFTQSALK